jgi:hypothetical protein
MDRILITPPAGWDVWSAEDPFGNGWHTITFVANKHRKPGSTLNIHTGDRQPMHTEESFLSYVEELYSESAHLFVEKEPSFKKFKVNNDIAYYTVASYSEYVGKPPARGRAKVCGILFLHRENNPLVSASLYVDDPNDPALDLMVKTILEMEMSFPNYQSDIINFNKNNSAKIDIPSKWGVIRGRGTPITGMARTYDLNIISPPDEKALLIVTIGRSRTREPITEQQFNALIEGRAAYLLPQAVENNVTYSSLTISNGYSRYFVLTDASFDDKANDPDDYKFIGTYYANYDNGCLIYATILSDNPHSISFQHMLDILSTIEPMLE